MSDELSPEEQAERILDGALEGVNLDVNGTECPQGGECAVHFRNNEEIIDDETEFGRLITYVGEFCVVTTDNPELENPVTIFRLLTRQITQDQLPPIYETYVVAVGADGTLAEVRDSAPEVRRMALRFIQTHDSWENFRTAHQSVVDGISSGLLDVSEPIERG